MIFSDLTNVEKKNQQLKTKQLNSQSKSPQNKGSKTILQKKQEHLQIEINKFQIEWVDLQDYEKEIMSLRLSSNYQFGCYDQFLWFQGYQLHFIYPQKLEHINIPESLQNHQICEQKRHSLFCWMGYVMGSYQNASNETYFLAISIFDKFIKQYTQCLTNQELLSIGICCLSLASKQKDVYSLTSKQLIQLSGDKLNENILIQCQIKILETINYQIEQPNYFQFFDYLMRDLEYRYYQKTQNNIQTDSLTKQKFIIIYKYALLLLRFVTQYYDSTMFKQSIIAYSCIYLTLLHMENQNFILPQYLYEIFKQIKEDQDIINIEITIRYIQMLCKHGLSEKQREFFSETFFNY